MGDEIKREEEKFDTETREQYSKVFEKEQSQFTEEELKKRVLKFLGTKVIGTLATCYQDQPRATPVRYSHDGWTIYIMTEGGGKLYNIERNPLVSFSVFGNYSGFRSVRGLQLWGRGDILKVEDGDVYQAAFQVLALEEREDLKRLARENLQPGMPIIRITPSRVRYLSLPEGILNQELIFSGKDG